MKGVRAIEEIPTQAEAEQLLQPCDGAQCVGQRCRLVELLGQPKRLPGVSSTFREVATEAGLGHVVGLHRLALSCALRLGQRSVHQGAARLASGRRDREESEGHRPFVPRPRGEEQLFGHLAEAIHVARLEVVLGGEEPSTPRVVEIVGRRRLERLLDEGGGGRWRTTPACPLRGLLERAASSLSGPSLERARWRARSSGSSTTLARTRWHSRRVLGHASAYTVAAMSGCENRSDVSSGMSIPESTAG